MPAGVRGLWICCLVPDRRAFAPGKMSTDEGKGYQDCSWNPSAEDKRILG
jgi:hypothetical protein